MLGMKEYVTICEYVIIIVKQPWSNPKDITVKTEKKYYLSSLVSWCLRKYYNIDTYFIYHVKDNQQTNKQKITHKTRSGIYKRNKV